MPLARLWSLKQDDCEPAFGQSGAALIALVVFAASKSNMGTVNLIVTRVHVLQQTPPDRQRCGRDSATSRVKSPPAGPGDRRSVHVPHRTLRDVQCVKLSAAPASFALYSSQRAFGPDLCLSDSIEPARGSVFTPTPALPVRARLRRASVVVDAERRALIPHLDSY